MQTALRMMVPILPGNRIELSAPFLPPSGEIEIIIVFPENDKETLQTLQPLEPPQKKRSVRQFLASIPERENPVGFDSWKEYEDFLQEEKEAWDR